MGPYGQDPGRSQKAFSAASESRDEINDHLKPVAPGEAQDVIGFHRCLPSPRPMPRLLVGSARSSVLRMSSVRTQVRLAI